MCGHTRPTRRALLAAGGAALLAGCGGAVRRTAAAAPTDHAAPPVSGSAAPAAPRVAQSTPPHAPGGPATELVTAASGRREVALTFHTNGDPVLVRGLLDALAAARAPATCMLVANWAVDHGDLVRRMVDDGHEIGNHTWSHLADLGTASETVVRGEVQRSHDAIATLTGSPGRFFRPSAMHHSTAAVLTEAGRAGYANCLSYDVDPLDYQDVPSAQVVRTILATARPGSVVSLHFGHATTVAALPTVVSGLRSRGLTPVTASALFA